MKLLLLLKIVLLKILLKIGLLMLKYRLLPETRWISILMSLLKIIILEIILRLIKISSLVTFDIFLQHQLLLALFDTYKLGAKFLRGFTCLTIGTIHFSFVSNKKAFTTIGTYFDSMTSFLMSSWIWVGVMPSKDLPFEALPNTNIPSMSVRPS